MSDQPIEVNPSQLPTSISTLLRYGLTALGGVLISRGVLPAGSNVEIFVGGALTIISTGYGLYKAYVNKAHLVTVANAAPDHVAVVK